MSFSSMFCRVVVGRPLLRRPSGFQSRTLYGARGSPWLCWPTEISSRCFLIAHTRWQMNEVALIKICLGNFLYQVGLPLILACTFIFSMKSFSTFPLSYCMILAHIYLMHVSLYVPWYDSVVSV